GTVTALARSGQLVFAIVRGAQGDQVVTIDVQTGSATVLVSNLTIAGRATEITGMDVNAEGDLIALDSANNRLVRIRASVNNQIGSVRAMTFDSNGQLYVIT